MFDSFRRVTGNGILIFMTASTATAYIISQSFRFYHSLQPDTILRRDIAIAQAKLFLDRFDNNSKNVSSSSQYCYYQNREVIFRQLQLTYETLHHEEDVIGEIDTDDDEDPLSGCSLGSLLPHPLSWFLNRVSSLVFLFLPKTSMTNSSSSPFSIFYSPWHEDENILKLRQCGRFAFEETVNRKMKSTTTTTTTTTTTLDSFLKLRALLLVADRHHIDYSWKLRLQKWILEKQLTWNGFKRGFGIMIELLLAPLRNKAKEQSSSTTTTAVNHEKLLAMKNQITMSSSSSMFKNNFFMNLPAKFIDWYSTSS